MKGMQNALSYSNVMKLPTDGMSPGAGNDYGNGAMSEWL